MAHQVRLTADAVADLDELYAYVGQHDSPQSAESLLARIEAILDSLAHSPNRGSHPKELFELGIRDYREVFFKPYRVIYRVIGKIAYVYLIVDGRRDMQALLRRRLLGA